MRRGLFVVLQGGALAALFIVVSLVCTVADSEDSSAHVNRIENGLLGAATIKGRPVETMRLADRMRHYNVPGVSIAFFQHGRIVWTLTYGFADVSTNKPVTPETLFQAGSISKPLAAMAALGLVQKGKLTLDGDVNLKLRTWKVPENEFTKSEKVTLRRILSHTAGFTVHGFNGYADGEPLPKIIQILNGEKPANNEPIRVHSTPGAAWDYSGGGYVVLQLLLTDVTGKPFPELLNELVLRPTSMVHSTFEQPLPKKLWADAAMLRQRGPTSKRRLAYIPGDGPCGPLDYSLRPCTLCHRGAKRIHGPVEKNSLARLGSSDARSTERRLGARLHPRTFGS